MRRNKLLVVSFALLACGQSNSSATNPDPDTGHDPDERTPELAGIYDVSGSDASYGDYTGRAEVRLQDGATVVHHVQTYDSATFEDHAIAQAWTGELRDEAAVAVELRRDGFLMSYGGSTRDGADLTSVALEGKIERIDDDTLSLSFTTAGGETWSTETWTHRGPSGDEPIWQNRRELIATHSEPPQKFKDDSSALFASYHQLPEVQPYVDRPEFLRGVHYTVKDTTDFDFYRENPNTVRVIQRVIEPMTLADAEQRRRAYSLSLADKAAYYDASMPSQHLNPAGTYSEYNPDAEGDLRFVESYDATLWTGLYAASQAMRYLVTEEGEAYANMISAIDGLLLMYDIAPTKGDFARAVRPERGGAGAWVQGEGEYAGWDWRPGANNDMIKGFTIAFAWAWLAMEREGGDSRQARMITIAEELLETELGADNGNDELTLNLFLWFADQNVNAYVQFQTLLAGVGSTIYEGEGSGFYEYGVSDWSGLHLNIQALLTQYVMADELGDDSKNKLRDAIGTLQDEMAGTRRGLIDLIAASVSQAPLPQLQDDALWVMREIPVPKSRYDIDHRMQADFCMSPLPNLPWKNDWTETDRFNGLHGYPVFERRGDPVEWKEKPFAVFARASNVEYGGTDYLFAYWYGRLQGLIDASL